MPIMVVSEGIRENITAYIARVSRTWPECWLSERQGSKTDRTRLRKMRVEEPDRYQEVLKKKREYARERVKKINPIPMLKHPGTRMLKCPHCGGEFMSAALKRLHCRECSRVFNPMMHEVRY